MLPAIAMCLAFFAFAIIVLTGPIRPGGQNTPNFRNQPL
jgi:hypothetical protein